VTGGNSSCQLRLGVTLRWKRAFRIGSNAPHEANLCRRLERETGAWEYARTWLRRRGARAEECMARRPSFASRDSGTGSPEYGGESSLAGRGAPAAKPLPVAGVNVRSAHTAVVTILATVDGRLAELEVPVYTSGSGVAVLGEPAWLARADGCVPAELTGGRLRSGRAAGIARRRGELRVDLQPHAPAGRRDTRRYGDSQLGTVWPGQPGRPAVRCKFRLTGHRSAGREMVCKGDPCIYAADGDPMTWFTSPLVVPCGGIPETEGARRLAPGPRHPGQLTDVHGREG
jgi:hypothetical protein